jgi:Uma2 family endonuclease
MNTAKSAENPLFLSEETPVLMNKADFLRLSELDDDKRYEYIHGSVFIIASASFRHEAITANVISELAQITDESPCQVLASHRKVMFFAEELYFNPDAVVECPSDENLDVPLNVALVVEVLSPATVLKDVTFKLPLYMQMPTLQDILYISAERVSVLHYFKGMNEWKCRAATNLNDALDLIFVNGTLKVGRIYHKIRWE